MATLALNVNLISILFHIIFFSNLLDVPLDLPHIQVGRVSRVTSTPLSVQRERVQSVVSLGLNRKSLKIISIKLEHFFFVFMSKFFVKL